MSVLDDTSGRAAKPPVAAIATEDSSGQRPMPGITGLTTSGVDDGASDGCIRASIRSAIFCAVPAHSASLRGVRCSHALRALARRRAARVSLRLACLRRFEPSACGTAPAGAAGVSPPSVASPACGESRHRCRQRGQHSGQHRWRGHHVPAAAPPPCRRSPPQSASASSPLAAWNCNRPQYTTANHGVERTVSALLHRISYGIGRCRAVERL